MGSAARLNPLHRWHKKSGAGRRLAPGKWINQAPVVDARFLTAPDVLDVGLLFGLALADVLFARFFGAGNGNLATGSFAATALVAGMDGVDAGVVVVAAALTGVVGAAFPALAAVTGLLVFTEATVAFAFVAGLDVFCAVFAFSGDLVASALAFFAPVLTAGSNSCCG